MKDAARQQLADRLYNMGVELMFLGTMLGMKGKEVNDMAAKTKAKAAPKKAAAKKKGAAPKRK